MKWNWYITIEAIRQYMEIAGLRGPPEADNPAFNQAEEALGALSLTARLTDQPPGRSGALCYRGWIEIPGKRRTDGKSGSRRRIECTVIPGPTREGPLPQLVRVRLK